jgi:hypothetical protein
MRQYVFADEAGNFDFSRHASASRYFILCTVTLTDCAIGTQLLELRRDMAWRRSSLDGELHASTDAQGVRDEVFALLQKVDFRVDATILEKAKAQPQTHTTDTRFYKYAWLYHFGYVAGKILGAKDELFLSAASVGTKARGSAFREAIEDVAQQVSPALDHRVVFWPAACDPCLQVADYCTWAIQRKWERADDRSFKLIKSKVKSEYDLWQIGKKVYY